MLLFPIDESTEPKSTARYDGDVTDRSAGAVPALEHLTRWRLASAALSLGVAFVLIVWLGYRFAIEIDLWQWWVPFALVLGIATADFGSGLVHWGADTWGRDDYPIIGERLLVPFRVHHINPEDFLRRRFIDANGDVALATIPVLIVLHSVPLDRWWGSAAAVFGFGLCAVGSLTNQIHQWSHMSHPPYLVRVLQWCGFLLGRAEHARHHQRPYDGHYCITTGWCNRPLEAIGFFRRLERAITHLTGAQPRHDDRRYEVRFGQPAHAAGNGDE